MAFLRSATPEDYQEPIKGRQLLLRAPSASDYAAWAALRDNSRAHLRPWEPTWLPDDLSRLMFRRRLRAYAQDVRDDAAYTYFITTVSDGTLLGGVTLSNIRRGVSQSAAIGYWVGAPFAGRGVMTETLSVLLPFAFNELRLHRIEAASMPANTASVRVLEKSGFMREGIVRGYLKINGRWEDHILFARLAPDLQATERDTALPRSAEGV